MGAITCLQTLGIKKEVQVLRKARERHLASLVPSSHLQICEEFRSISRKIYEKPNSIEELAELREWMKGIPEKLVGLEVRCTYGSQGVGAGVQDQDPRSQVVPGTLRGWEIRNQEARGEVDTEDRWSPGEL